MNEEKYTEEIVPFLTDIPAATVELEIKAKVYESGEIQEYLMKIDSVKAIRDGMISGWEYEMDNGEFYLKI